MKKFLRDNWKKIAGLAVAVVGEFVPALKPLQLPGAILFGTDFQVGSQVGTPIGAGAKDLADKIKKAVKP